MSSAKNDPFKIRRTVKQKKIFQMVLVRKVGPGFEVSNGTVKFSGPNREDLLATMDAWEAAMHKAMRENKTIAPKKTSKSKAKKKPAKD